MAAGMTNVFTSVAFVELGLSVTAVERGQRRTSNRVDTVWMFFFNNVHLWLGVMRRLANAANNALQPTRFARG